jgi:hypothetical protein
MRYVILLLVLAACTARGPTFNESSVPIGDNATTLVVYRPTGFTGAATGWDVDINGATHCNLHNGAFYIDSLPLGKINISSSIWSAPGTTRLSFVGKPKTVYYVRLEADGGKAAASILAGAAGMFAAEGVSSTGGPFLLTLVEEQEAMQEIKGMNQDCL